MTTYFMKQFKVCAYPYLIIEWGDEVLEPGGIWGWVQGVGSDH